MGAACDSSWKRGTGVDEEGAAACCSCGCGCGWLSTTLRRQLPGSAAGAGVAAGVEAGPATAVTTAGAVARRAASLGCLCGHMRRCGARTRFCAHGDGARDALQLLLLCRSPLHAGVVLRLRERAGKAVLMRGRPAGCCPICRHAQRSAHLLLVDLIGPALPARDGAANGGIASDDATSDVQRRSGCAAGSSNAAPQSSPCNHRCDGWAGLVCTCARALVVASVLWPLCCPHVRPGRHARVTRRTFAGRPEASAYTPTCSPSSNPPRGPLHASTSLPSMAESLSAQHTAALWCPL